MRPDSLPMLAVSAMLRAPSHLEPVCRDSVAVTAAAAAGAIVMNAQLDATERAFTFDNASDRQHCLIGERLVHSVTVLLPGRVRRLFRSVGSASRRTRCTNGMSATLGSTSPLCATKSDRSCMLLIFWRKV
jgi:hypothetical protein